MAEKYWVGGSGTWDNSTTTNWSNSDGGAGGAAVPSATDNANFTTSSGNGTVTIAATAACANLVVNWTNVKTNIFSLSGNFSPAGNITINGNSTINRILIQSSVVGTQRTITNLGTVTCANVDFMDIKFNTAVDFSAQTNIGDANGNSGITFPASVTQTATGTVSFNWSDVSKWTTRVPLPQDDVIVGNSFSASQFIGCDMPRLGRSIDFSGATGNVDLRMGTIAVSIYGSLTLGSGLTVSGVNALTLAGRGNYTITSAGKTFTQALVLSAPSGTYTLQDALITASSFNPSYGTFNSNSFGVTCTGFASNNGSYNRTIIAGSSIWTLTTGDWDYQNGTKAYTDDGSTIKFTYVGASTRTFAGGSLTYGTLDFTVAGSTAQLNVTGSNSFAAINFSDASNARSLKFTNGTTTTIRNGNGFNVRGTAGKLMTVASLTTPTGRWGDAISLTGGTAAYSSVDHADFKPTGNFSISGWIKTSTDADGAIFSSYSQNPNRAGISMRVDNVSNSIVLLSGDNAGGFGSYTSTTNIIDNAWHFIVGTWDGITLRIYIDGTQEGTGTAYAVAPAYAATNYVRVGARNLTGTDTLFYTGLLDDIALWNGKALSASEITSLYTDEINHNALRTDSSLKAYYRFETGALTTDTTAGAHTLTAIGAPAGTAASFTLTSSNQQAIDYASLNGAIVNNSPKWYAGTNSTDAYGTSNWMFTNSPESVNSFTQYSPQYCLNFIYGTPDTQYSLQEIANLYNGTPSTKLSFQEVLNHRDGLPPNARSAQEALFENVKTVLGLSDPYTQYPLQYLLNLCKSRGIGLSTIFG